MIVLQAKAVKKLQRTSEPQCADRKSAVDHAFEVGAVERRARLGSAIYSELEARKIHPHGLDSLRPMHEVKRHHVAQTECRFGHPHICRILRPNDLGRKNENFSKLPCEVALS